MAVKKEQVREMNNVMEMGRKVVLAYVGAFGMAGDKLVEWFDLFVKRGQITEKHARKLMQRNEKQVRKFAGDLQKQEKAVMARTDKTVKKTVKKAQALV
jgi:polyhydroxyalkanoate synthesis regulator phasin